MSIPTSFFYQSIHMIDFPKCEHCKATESFEWHQLQTTGCVLCGTCFSLWEASDSIIRQKINCGMASMLSSEIIRKGA